MLKRTQLQPLPRCIRRRNLRQAIKEGKPAYDRGLAEGYAQGFIKGQQAAIDEINAGIRAQVDAARAADPQVTPPLEGTK